MMHLTDDEIYELPQLTEDCQPYSLLNLSQMEHLKMCEWCYKKFCSALAILEVTSESGYLILSEMYGMNAESVSVTENVKFSQGKRILAALQVIREKIEDRAVAIIKQVEQPEAAFSFVPVLAVASRGREQTGSGILKAEDMDDERTFMMFDTQKGEFLIQLNRAELEAGDIKVCLCFGVFEALEVPLEEKGKILKGFLRDIPDGDFEIRIEYMEM